MSKLIALTAFVVGVYFSYYLGRESIILKASTAALNSSPKCFIDVWDGIRP